MWTQSTFFNWFRLSVQYIVWHKNSNSNFREFDGLQFTASRLVKPSAQRKTQLNWIVQSSSVQFPAARTGDGRRRSSQRKTELNDAVEFSWVEISFPLRIGLYIHNWSDYVANLNAFATRLNNEVLNTIKLASCTCSYGGVWTVMVGSGNISAFRSEWTVCWMISWKMDHCRVSCSVACIYTSPRRL